MKTAESVVLRAHWNKCHALQVVVRARRFTACCIPLCNVTPMKQAALGRWRCNGAAVHVDGEEVLQRIQLLAGEPGTAARL